MMFFPAVALRRATPGVTKLSGAGQASRLFPGSLSGGPFFRQPCGRARPSLHLCDTCRGFSGAAAAAPQDTSAGTGPITLVVEEIEEPKKEDEKSGMTPSEVVEYLDRFIVGQRDAKKACANALRSRWRRQRLPAEMQEDVVPRNILMIGPTGVGKTEIARRLAKLVDSPFVKVEATKFTEVGYRGRDVDQIMRDLMEVGLKMQRTKLEDAMRPQATLNAEKTLLDQLFGKAENQEDRDTQLKQLREGELDDRSVVVDVPVTEKGCPRAQGNRGGAGGDGSSPGPDISNFLQDLLSRAAGEGKTVRVIPGNGNGGAGQQPQKTEKRKLGVKDAMKRLVQAELDATISAEAVLEKALESVQQEGIVFIDEIDKIVSGSYHYGPDASAEGVQRDLLPLIEGSSISTRYGDVKTDHILFIASGAFHSVKPADMLAELQGRLPVRVELSALTEADMERILTEPEYNLIRQNIELLKTEGVDLTFNQEAILEIAKVSTEINTRVENIGARRLYTVVEKLLEEISYEAAEYPEGTKKAVTREMVRESVGDMLKKADLHKHIL